MTKEDIIVIGKIAKPEGIKGFLRPDIDTEFEKSLLRSPFVFIFMDGLPVPFKVLECKPDKNYIVKLKDIDSPEVASRLTNLTIGLHRKHVLVHKKVTTIGLDKWLGYTIVCEDATVGLIKEMAKFPGQIMAVIEIQNGQIIHIPMIEEWIVKTDSDRKIIEMNLPSGLLEVF